MFLVGFLSFLPAFFRDCAFLLWPFFSFLFWLSPQFRAGEIFAPQPQGNACYAGYGEHLKTRQCMLNTLVPASSAIILAKIKRIMTLPALELLTRYQLPLAPHLRIPSLPIAFYAKRKYNKNLWRTKRWFIVFLIRPLQIEPFHSRHFPPWSLVNFPIF